MATCMGSSSLMQRRGRMFRNNAPPLHTLVDEKGSPGCSTTASSASASPDASPEPTPKIMTTGISGIRRRPSISINCELVLQDQQASADPFLLSQCRRLNEKYHGFEKLGEGSCGVVYKVRTLTDCQEVAIKVMRMDDEERLCIAQKEYELLRQVSHPKIIRALDFFTYSMGAVLVLDYFEGKTLDKAVRAVPGCHFQEHTVRHLSTQLLGAVAYLHSSDIIHRDIKADNILVSSDLTDLRLVDFNAAKSVAESQALTLTGTVDYMPPEVLHGESPSEPGDIWAVGLCLYLMLNGRLPSERRALRIQFDFASVEVMLHQGSLVWLDGAGWESISEPCKEVVREALKFHIDLRPTAASILAMPWFVAEPVEMAPNHCVALPC